MPSTPSTIGHWSSRIALPWTSHCPAWCIRKAPSRRRANRNVSSPWLSMMHSVSWRWGTDHSEFEQKVAWGDQYNELDVQSDVSAQFPAARDGARTRGSHIFSQGVCVGIIWWSQHRHLNTFSFSFSSFFFLSCPFSDMFDRSRMSLCNGSWDGLRFMYSCLNQHWASSCPIRQHQLQYPPNFRCSRSGWNSSPLCISLLCLSKVVWHSIKFSTFHKAFTNWSNESSLVLVITRKLFGCIPLIFKFLGNLFSRTQTGLIQHQMLSHVLWCNFTHVNCPSDTITYAFTGSCRVLFSIFVPLSNIDSWIWWRECWFQQLIQEVCCIPSCWCSHEGLPCLMAVSVFSGSHISTRFIFAKQR